MRRHQMFEGGFSVWQRVAEWPFGRWGVWVLGLLLGVLLAFGNLPWQLDNYDQAKQAFTSFEISQGGHPFYQHTPRGKMATKPPLAGWMSLVTYWVTGWWDLAWRLPGLLAALGLIAILVREGERLWAGSGGVVAVAAFGFNMLTPRLATLVRTDMLLTLWISLCGFMIFWQVSRARQWTFGTRLLFALAMAAALFTKGPVIYAFLLPGMIIFYFIASREVRGLVWAGWWPWLVPLALFLLWLGAGLALQPEFYRQVVVEEFLSRFDQSLKSDERQQPLWFYFPHLIHKLLPWSILCIILPVAYPEVRRGVRQRPELLWLACWVLGALILMTLVPSKRVDRIFPVVVPLVLLMVGMAGCCSRQEIARKVGGLSALGAAVAMAGYFATVVWIGYRDDYHRVREFGEEVRAMVEREGVGRLALVDGKEEGLVIYTGAGKVVRSSEGIRQFLRGEAGALLIPRRRLPEEHVELGLGEPVLVSGPTPQGEEYLLYLRKKLGP